MEIRDILQRSLGDHSLNPNPPTQKSCMLNSHPQIHTPTKEFTGYQSS